MSDNTTTDQNQSAGADTPEQPRVYAALVHFPTIDRRKMAVATSVTTLDVHDIARSSRTYGIKRYYVVTPIEPQHWIVKRIIEHWESEWGQLYNPNRGDALGTVELIADIAAVAESIREREGEYPVIVATSARHYPNTITFRNLRKQMHAPGAPPYLLIFGTGWGLHPELVCECDLTLQPIDGPTPYNHLSVRSAAAICFDRLLAPEF
ncbi:RNA methyltransferase [Candidatus Sumerlaeota bacterium]|nr:RNA methyltransferase [Candidatus Sumerlaeota bacterium]